MDSERRRRAFLRLAGSAAIAGFAGCTGGEGTNGGEAGSGGTDASQGGENGTAAGSGGQTTGNGNETERADDRAGGNNTTTGAGGGKTSANGTTDLGGPVPDTYRTATSQGGTKRDPDSLQSKRAVQYQSHPNDGQHCSDCRFFVPDKNGDGLGACSVVEGYIQPEGWCISFSPTQNG